MAKTGEERREYFREYYKRPGRAESIRVGVCRRRGMPVPTRAKPELCECCGRQPSLGKSLGIDHDHETGAFRGWICTKCNLGLGMFGDTAESIELALQYLKRAAQ